MIIIFCNYLTEIEKSTVECLQNDGEAIRRSPINLNNETKELSLGPQLEAEWFKIRIK